MKERNTTGLRRAVSSAQFEKRLFRAYPQWRPLAAYRPARDYRNGEERAYLYLEVPSANPAVAEPLWIQAGPNEVIIGWGALHNHFDWQSDYQGAALEHLADILADRYLFAHAGPDGEPVTRSWRGTRDRDAPPDMNVRG